MAFENVGKGENASELVFLLFFQEKNFENKYSWPNYLIFKFFLIATDWNF